MIRSDNNLQYKNVIKHKNIVINEYGIKEHKKSFVKFLL